MAHIIDLHCDTLLECYLKQEKLRDRGGHLNLEKMKKAGIMAQCFACFIPMGEEAASCGVTLPPYEVFQEIYQLYLREMEENKDVILPARTAADIEANQKAGFLSALLTIEDSALLSDDIRRVDEMADKGVIMMTLIWNFENCMGYPNNKETEKHMLGLKPFGIEALERMNQLGIIADVSHLSEGGFYDVARYGKKPFAASHSCARALCSHQRNLTDDQLRIIGETGSVAGVNFNSYFLDDDSQHTPTASIVRHLVYMADKAGVEGIAMGSDFDGIGCGLEMVDCLGFDKLLGGLQKHFTDDQIDKICSGNFLRVMKENGR